ncbi:MAG: hypothetical protein HY740_11075 [Chloroflexi bacterium]|nr:hypothetical protein [Chloroflexota bacterium]
MDDGNTQKRGDYWWLPFAISIAPVIGVFICFAALGMNLGEPPITVTLTSTTGSSIARLTPVPTLTVNSVRATLTPINLSTPSATNLPTWTLAPTHTPSLTPIVAPSRTPFPTRPPSSTPARTPFSSLSTLAPLIWQTPNVSEVNFSGTGPMTFKAHESPTFYFRPYALFLFQYTKAFIVHLVSPKNLQGRSTLQFYYLNKSGAGWRMIDLNWGVNKVADTITPDYFRADGSMYANIRNWGSEPVEIENLSLTVLILSWDGTDVIYGDAPWE